MGSKKVQFKEICFCVLLALVVSVFFNQNLFFEGVSGTDSSVFIYIGKQMHNGFIPYKDLFDHKGIVLYFIEYLGTFIPYRYGIGIIEVVNMWLFLWFALSLTKKYITESRYQFGVLFIVSVVIGARVYEGGNLVEEYAMPWIMLTVNIIDDYVRDRNSLTSWRLMASGFGFAFVVLLRPNMIAVWFTGALMVLYENFKEGTYRLLASNIFFFVCGCLVLCVPCLLYFFLTNSLDNMIDCYWKFNIEYSSLLNSYSYSYNYNLGATEGLSLSVLISSVFMRAKVLLVLLLKKFFLGTIGLLAMLYLNRANTLVRVHFCMTVVAILFMSLSGRGYPHYLMVLLPLTIVPVCCGTEWIVHNFKNRLVCGILAVILASSFLEGLGRISWKTDVQHPIVALMEGVKPNDEVLILGNDCKYYLLSNKLTLMKYFYQYPPCSCSKYIYDDFLRDFKHTMPKYVVVGSEKKYNLSVSLIKWMCSFLITDEEYEEVKYRVKTFVGIKHQKDLVSSMNLERSLNGSRREFLNYIGTHLGYSQVVENGVFLYRRNDY